MQLIVTDCVILMSGRYQEGNKNVMQQAQIIVNWAGRRQGEIFEISQQISKPIFRKPFIFNGNPNDINREIIYLGVKLGPSRRAGVPNQKFFPKTNIAVTLKVEKKKRGKLYPEAHRIETFKFP